MEASASQIIGQDVAVQADIQSPSRAGLFSTKNRHWNWVTLGFGVMALAIVVPLVFDQTLSVANNYRRRGGFPVSDRMMKELGMEGVVMFKQHDRDNDGVLTLEEFEPLAHRLALTNETYTYDREIEATDEVLTIEARFTPLNIDTLSKNISTIHVGKNRLDTTIGLKIWKALNRLSLNFGASHFKGFFPVGTMPPQNAFGKVYWLIEPVVGTERHGPALSSNRYFPLPLVTAAEIIVHRLLLLFHKRPFVHSRFAPQGSTAIVRAYNDAYVDIVFRIHAEFQLNEPPFYPFWFTPAQFTGHLTIRQDGHHVESFHLYVPSDKRLNVDMEWMNGPKEVEDMEVDIGYMSTMELYVTGPSIPVATPGDDTVSDLTDNESQRTSIKWREEISKKKKVPTATLR